MTEKLDGQRAQWQPERGVLISRYGNIIPAPEWFLEPFRDITFPLDGELFLGYGNWGLTGIFRTKTAIAHQANENIWKRAKFMIFDIPMTDAGTYEDRRQALEKRTWVSPMVLIPRVKVTGKAMMEDYYQDILSRGGEGIMLNNPCMSYSDGRTDSILKHKPVLDDECVVVGYKPGQGSWAGKLGAFIVHPIEDGVPNKKREFRISGMNSVVRANYKKTHPLGTVISYRCSEFTKLGKPRFPTYIGKCKKVVMSLEQMEKVMTAVQVKSTESNPLVETLPVPPEPVLKQKKRIIKPFIKPVKPVKPVKRKLKICLKPVVKTY